MHGEHSSTKSVAQSNKMPARNEANASQRPRGLGVAVNLERALMAIIPTWLEKCTSPAIMAAPKRT